MIFSPFLCLKGDQTNHQTHFVVEIGTSPPQHCKYKWIENSVLCQLVGGRHEPLIDFKQYQEFNKFQTTNIFHHLFSYSIKLYLKSN